MLVSMHTMRRGDGVSSAVKAGDMASSIGKAMVTPETRNAARRERLTGLTKYGIQYPDGSMNGRLAQRRLDVFK